MNPTLCSIHNKYKDFFESLIYLGTTNLNTLKHTWISLRKCLDNEITPQPFIYKYSKLWYLFDNFSYVGKRILVIFWFLFLK